MPLIPLIIQNLQAAFVAAKAAPQPAAPSGNIDITLGNRSEATGRFNFVTDAAGDVSFDDTQTHAVMTSAMEDKAGYWVDATHGSDLFTLKNLTRRTPSQAEAMVLDALNPIETDNSIANPSASAKASTLLSTGGGRLDVLVKWSTPSGLIVTQTVSV